MPRKRKIAPSSLPDLLDALLPPDPSTPTAVEDEPLVGDVPTTDEAVLPGFAMEDAEDEEIDGLPSAELLLTPVSRNIPDGDIAPPGKQFPSSGVKYESRIRVLDAWQYRGALLYAPAWVDPNWVGYGDHDPLRGIEAGPALRVPDRRGGVTLARIGDYIVKQEVILAHGVPADVVIEVWTKTSFEKTFIPEENRVEVETYKQRLRSSLRPTPEPEDGARDVDVSSGR